MIKPISIDFVSDVACPWCAMGLASLETALARIGPDIAVDLRFQPFELNPQMPAGGQDLAEHLAEKYGATVERQAQMHATIRQRGAEVGFAFAAEGRGRVYNTFDAHRLLTWAEAEDTEHGSHTQRALKTAVLRAYHSEAQNMDSHEVLTQLAGMAGLPIERAQQILTSDAFARETREREAFYTGKGIRAVPSVIINGKELIQGGQPPEVFERALRQIAAPASQSTTNEG